MLTINDLQHAYQSGHPILQGIQLDVPAGERHGILGPNGAGKTTLFHLISGQLPVKAGAIDFEGHSLKKEQVSLLEAEPWFYPYMTGMEYLRFFRDDKAAIERWNTIFELPLNELAEEYSTGMKKKLGLMGVLLQPERPVLILDEPFNGVDYESNEKIMALLEHRATDQRILLISSHILHTLTRVCDRISVLREGRIARTYERAQFDELEAAVREGVSDEVKKMMEGFDNSK